jgi:hypothetical protein
MAMDYKNIKALLQQFADATVMEAQQNIGASQSVSRFKISNTIRKNFNASGTLRNSLRGKVNADLGVSFYAVGKAKEYAHVIEHGQMGKREAPTNDPKFMPTPGKLPVASMPPSSVILKWMNTKNIKLREAGTGKFTKATEAKKRSVAYAIAKAIERRGRVGLHYFENAYLDTLELYGPKMLKAAGQDINVELLKTFRLIKKR